MERKHTIHIIDADSRHRATLSRQILALGRHCEVYASQAEFLARPPASGVVLLHEKAGQGGIPSLLATLAEQGAWLPVVGIADRPDTTAIVAAMRAGALDYLVLPLDDAVIIERIGYLERESHSYSRARHKMIIARSRLTLLSKREREVLDCLADGRSNKVIARELAISPRTVEIHRANMMGKLGANHSAQAIRMRLEAGMIEEMRLAG